MDINLPQLAQLIAIAEQANIDELEINEGHCSIRITCHSHHQHHSKHTTHAHNTQSLTQSSEASQPLVSPVLFSKSNQSATPLASMDTKNSQLADNATNQTHAPDTPASNHITSPMLGTFYRKSSPDVPPFVEVGQTVAIGDTLCIIEAMKIMHEVKAEQAGVVREILVNDGDTVEYAQPIFAID